MQPDISVIIPNYNNAQYLAKCIAAVWKDPAILEIIVVDDASTDNSLEVLAQFPVRVIRNEKNLGPVGSRNIGAQGAKGTYLLFLDADAEINNTYASALRQFLIAHPHAGIVTGKVISEKNERMWFNFGYEPSIVRNAIARIFPTLRPWTWPPRARNVLYKIAEPFTLNFVPDKERRVDWVVEMGCMTPRAIFEALGGFDAHFFMFFEGPDYCRRARDKGYEAWFTPVASLRHLGGHSHPSDARGRHFRESRRYYMQKHGFRLW